MSHPTPPDCTLNIAAHILCITACCWMLAACTAGSKHTAPVPETRKESAPAADTAQNTPNIESMTLQELRLLRSSVYAAHGVLFRESDLLQYWRSNTLWYDTLSRSRRADEWNVSLARNEQSLVDRIDSRMTLLQQNNHIRSSGDTLPNIMNIVNMFQFGEIKQQQIMDDLAVYGYAAQPDSLQQLFHTYRQNDSLQIPAFVTVDLIAQLSHVYETFVLQTIEEKHLAPLLEELCSTLFRASVDQYTRAAGADLKNIAARNAAYFAVACNLLTGKSPDTPGDWQPLVEEELAYISQYDIHRPALLDMETPFNYGAFIPSGHYTRTATLRRYFKAWKWLQLAPFCTGNKTQLQQTVMIATALQTARTPSGTPAIDLYGRLYRTLEWFTGTPAFTSLRDVVQTLQRRRITGLNAAAAPQTLAGIAAATQRTAPHVQHAPACSSGIYFFPQPALLDAAIPQTLIHTGSDTVPAAHPAQTDPLTGTPFTSSGKRMESIRALTHSETNAPRFTKTPAWAHRQAETAAALQLKSGHDVQLYAQEPDRHDTLPAAPPADTLHHTISAGYVEPALLYWTTLREWLELTGETLDACRLNDSILIACYRRMHRCISLMENAARMELRGERLTEETSAFIAHIGDSIEQLTLSMLAPPVRSWKHTAGTDRHVAVAEKIYRTGAARPSAGAPQLYAATGNIRRIYVIVEIDGYLYLTRGASFSYSELFMPREVDLDGARWQNIRRRLLHTGAEPDTAAVHVNEVPAAAEDTTLYTL